MPNSVANAFKWTEQTEPSPSEIGRLAAQTHSQGHHPILIIDDAHEVSSEALREICALRSSISLILLGDLRLRERLAATDVPGAKVFPLPALRSEEVPSYVRHRLKIAGGERDVFTIAACERVHWLSDGVPRVINILCALSLRESASRGAERVDAEVIDEIARRRKFRPAPEITRRDERRATAAAAVKLPFPSPASQSPLGMRRNSFGDGSTGLPRAGVLVLAALAFGAPAALALQVGLWESASAIGRAIVWDAEEPHAKGGAGGAELTRRNGSSVAVPRHEPKPSAPEVATPLPGSGALEEPAISDTQASISNDQLSFHVRFPKMGEGGADAPSRTDRLGMGGDPAAAAEQAARGAAGR